MTAERRLAIGAAFFAVFWTIFMLWWSWPHDTAGIVIMCVIGVILGFAWYWAMRRFGSKQKQS